MGRLNKSGVRGLIVERVTDAAGKVTERYSIDLRWRDANGVRQRYRERLPDGTKASAAKKRAQDIHNSATSGTLQARGGEQHLLGVALDKVREWAETNRPQSLGMYKTQVAALKRVLGKETAIGDLSAFALERFKSVRLKELRKGLDEDDAEEQKIGNASVNRGLAVLWKSCALWVGWGWMKRTTEIELREVERLREPEGRVRFMSPEEESTLLAALPAGMVRVALAATLTGMRRSELARLKKVDVDLRAREISVVKSKSGKTRRIPINDALKLVLKEAMDAAPKEYVFTNEDGEPYQPDSLTHAHVRACKTAKIDDLRFHDLRHHFATTLRRAGADLDIVRQLLGHATLQMTTRYAHVGRDELHAAVALIGGSDRIAQFSGEEGDQKKAKA